MARAQTAKYEEFILEVEHVASSGTFTKLCGITDVQINRSSNIDTTEVPDCDDESLPLGVERAVRSQEVTVSGSGVWDLNSNQQLLAWWRSGATRVARLRNVKTVNDGSGGDIYAEYGPAILVSVNNSRTKGQKVTAEIEIQFDGVPETLTN